MKLPHRNQRSSWLPQLDRRVWILSIGRFLSQIGSGFTLFYAPIFFVNQVGLSATAVGIGLGSAAVSGIIGRILGGTFADSKFWGRRRTLLLSCIVSTLASFVLAAAYNFPVFVIGNLLMGFGIGLYWPSMQAAVADITSPLQRNEAYALTELADKLGLGLGVVFGGLIIGTTGAYRTLFIIDGISFLVLFGVIYVYVAETNQSIKHGYQGMKGWTVALRDNCLLIYVLVNSLFTTYIVQTESTLPLYFSNFVQTGTNKGFSTSAITLLFTWYVVLTALCQLPIARALNRFRKTHVLILSALFWSAGFVFTWATGISPVGQQILAILTLAFFSIATVIYNPTATSLVAELAPDSLRGVYLSINSQCWAIGYFIGPTVGGFAMDQPAWIAHSYWLGVALTIIVAILILRLLDQMIHKQHRKASQFS